MLIDMLGFPWLAYAVLVIVTVAARLRCGSWFAPAAFVGLVWCFFTGVSLLIVDYPVPCRGLWILVLLIVAIQLGALIAHELQPRSIAPTAPDPTIALESLRKRLLWYGLVCTALALAGCVYFLFISLDQFNLPFTLLGVLQVGARWTWLRYDEVLEPWSVRLLIMWLHPAGLLGGVLFASSHRFRDRVLSLVTLLPALAYSFLIAARAPTLLGLTCWLGGYLATCCVGERGHPALFTRKRSGWILSVAACLVIGFVFVDALRDVPSTQDFRPQASETQIRNYMFGSPAAFADWYAHSEPSDAQWGALTFTGEFDLLQIKGRTLGTYSASSNVVGTNFTNVYTLFRNLIEDFTLLGATFICACIGGLTGWIYIRTRETNPLRALFWLSALYAATLFSPITSLFGFNGPMLAWVVAAIAIRKTKRSAATLALETVSV
jgi:oligosaccharide repeat unit polymerase